jgi:hypothetical protein
VIVSKREKYIAIGVATVIGLWIVDAVAIEPYRAALSDIQEQHDTAAKTLSDDASLLLRRGRLEKIWTVMLAHGFKTQEAEADSQLQHAILNWSQLAGVVPQTLKSDQPRKEGSFQVIGYRVSATGSMLQISRLLWALETATIPIRVSDIRITPEKEGTDQLSVQLGVSTLCIPGGAAPYAPSTAPSPASTTRPRVTLNADGQPDADGGI